MKKLFAIMLALIMVLAFIPAAATTAATSGTEITKVWENDDETNRPDSVKVQLLEGANVVETIELTKGGNWKGIFEKQESGKTYTIKEVNVLPNYTTTYTAPGEEIVTVGNWGEKITPASNPTYPLTGNIVVANKGGSYYIWTQDKLIDQQKSKLMAAINDANLNGLGKALTAQNTEFKYGIRATFGREEEVRIEKDGNKTTINFSETNVWSLFYEGTLSIESATGWIVKNTYTKTESDPDPETVTISIPIYKKVGQGGNTAPGKQTFTFVLSDFGADDAASQVTVANNTIETNGAGYYETVMTVTVDKNNIGNLSEGFKVTERNDGAPYWAYDATEWYVVPGMNNDQSTYCTFYNLTAGDKPRETQTSYNGISFTNIYTYNYNGGYNPTPVRPVQPAPLPPQTGDMPLWYAVAQFLGLVK
ncbi:MAG: Cna B-type domain-containing protein [Clostridiales bacterium]|nr:Cna B-type domain-containing protein [Clostridiales bacterium]